jgi:hypothetical protein
MDIEVERVLQAVGERLKVRKLPLPVFGEAVEAR